MDIPPRPNAAHPGPGSDHTSDSGQFPLHRFSLSERAMKFPLLGSVIPRKVKSTEAVTSRRKGRPYPPVTVKCRWIGIDGSQILPPAEVMTFGEKRRSSKFFQLAALSSPRLLPTPSLPSRLHTPLHSHGTCDPSPRSRSAKRQIPSIKIMQLDDF